MYSQVIHCDVTDESQVSSAVDRAITQFGKLDIIFNNAGIIGNDFKPRILDNTKSDFEKVLNVNLTGVFLCSKHAARVMVPARSGSIISTASVSSIVGASSSHAYTCAKHGVAGLTKNLAMELGQFGIRVNCYFKLDDAGIEETAGALANLKGVALRKEDVANAALYLGSDESKYVSGHNLVIDGGFTAGNPSFHLFTYPADS
ncbi:hypothetical protein ACHQM5_013729 [Ranunculus cassubicifolius]